MTNPTRNYAIEWILRRAGLTATQAGAIAAAVIAGADPVDAAGDVFGDVSGSLLGPLNVVGLLGSPINGPAADGQLLQYDESADEWVPVDATTIGAGLPWFNVTDPAYGATGDGATDDRAAINLAIAALNAAGAGVLYFPTPADAYRCTDALTAITADFVVMGDGSEGDHLAVRAHPTLIECESQTAVLFTTTALDGLFKDIVIRNTYAGTASAGAGISVQSPGGAAPQTARVIFENVKVEDFYDCFDIQVGSGWYMHGVHASSAVRYCIRVRNVASADFGDWEISDSWVYGYTHTPAAGLRIESSGGGRLVDVKFIFPGTYGIDIVGGAGTSNLQVTNTSIESYVVTGIRSVGSHPHQIYTNVQFGQYANGGSYGTGHAFDLSGNTDVIIDDVVFRTDVAGKTAVQHGTMTRFRLGAYTNNGFASLYNTPPDLDDTGGVGASVFITGTPSSGDVPIASSGTAAAWGAPSAAGAPTTADYLVGTAQAGLSAEIVVGTTPGGELGGTWASPTVDATHSGSTHVTTLDGLSDVVITAAASGDRLRYDGSSFVNSALRWEPHVAYDGTVVLNGNGDPVMVEVA